MRKIVLPLALVGCGASNTPTTQSPLDVERREAAPAIPLGVDTGRLKDLVHGDAACYVVVEAATGERHLPGDFELCKGGPHDASKLVGKQVRWTSEKSRVIAGSCQGDPECTEHDTVEVIKTLAESTPSPPTDEAALDASALVPPITVRVDRTPARVSGDCRTTRLRVHLTDAAGTTRTLEVGTITGMADEPEKAGHLTPTADGYAEPGGHCAGLREGVTLRLVGNALVRESAWLDSESGEGSVTKPAVTFAPGAEVVLR